MKLRRCTTVMFEPREEVSLGLQAILAGRAEVTTQTTWLALAAHLDQSVPVSVAQRELLGSLSSRHWKDASEVAATQADWQALLGAGLLISDGDEHAEHRRRDESMRDGHWWPLAALAHRHGRWSGVDSAAQMRESNMVTAQDLRQQLGAPPPAVQTQPGRYQALPAVEATEYDRMLERRTTCRNFDVQRSMSRELLAQLLHRTVKAQAVVRVEADTEFLKKNVPSGGGLHATETYLLIQRVEGLEPGLYHYHPVEHALVALPRQCGRPLQEVANAMLSGQDWFADAAVHLVLVPRYARTYWKYRNHSKAYRALLLDVGHISQAIYMAATERGMAAFVTAAINDVDTEAVFDLDGITQSPIAIVGVGWRSETLDTLEFDPNRIVWGQSTIVA
ncbi:putative peptide maturation dehydrogenase [Stenotrophomonas sp. ISL-67]|uniref:putative peptide maturation dehydrogenase n=1 Tax=Stenotrophomonas sp. ISL-67 TaxID=2819171 RepID=UPI001BE6FE6A|nr:putative peptide maturation dehydrogenase [Stenotrophomonas sp. ISL-67]MBT2767694.1 putative peptide maturation dehydrogenase [Stenotrophomonas sp. ISL-67]